MARRPTKRLNINGLIPDENYALQVRAVDGANSSPWSQKYSIKTIDDSVGGTRLPERPVLNTWNIDSVGQFVGTWNSVNLNDDGSPTVVLRYELELVADSVVAIIPHYGQSGTTQTRAFNQGHILHYFGGQTPPTITARLRVINTAGTASEWSEPLTATQPVPFPPRNPLADSVVDAVNVSWEPPEDPIHLHGYRVYLSMTTSDFVMDTTGRSNLVYEGPALSYAYTSGSYELTHYFKIVSYSIPGFQSSSVSCEGKPKSPYGPDDTPPLPPELSSVSMDRTVLTAAKANLSWTFDAEVEENTDISGFVVRWKISGDIGWRNAYFDKASRDGSIDLPRPFSNYVFEISAYDFVGNYSAYNGTNGTLTGATTPPTKLTGVDSIARFDGMRIVWNESTDSVKYGGRYQVQIKTTGAWPTDATDPKDTVVSYTATNTFIDITGLEELSTWDYRARAVDSANQYGPWSDDKQVTLPPFPVQAETDGDPPATAPANVKATGGLNYVNLSWGRVTNNDPVWYEVFMGASDLEVTDDSALFAGQSSGTSLMVATDPSGNPLAQGVEYFFKVRAVDADGHGPLSDSASSVLTQVLSSDLGINMGGENLYYNSSFDSDSDSNGVADYWKVFNGSTSVEPHTASLVSGRNGVGFAQKVEWAGVAVEAKGLTSNDSHVLRNGTQYVVSFYARSNGGTDSGFDITSGVPGALSDVVWISSPEPSATDWNRYSATFSTTGVPDVDNLRIVVRGHSTPDGWFEIDDAQVEAGNTASAYKTGTVSIAKLATGKLSSAELTISTGGSIKSENYDQSTGQGFMLTENGLDIQSGTVNAGTLVADSTITNDLYVGATLEIATAGLIKSSNYSDGSDLPAAGYAIGSLGIDIRSGAINVGVLKGGSITSTDVSIGTGGTLTIDSTGSIQSNNYSYNPVTDTSSGWKISSTGIEMWDANSKININALETSTMTSRVITLGSGGYLQSDSWVGGVGPRWKLANGPDGGFQMIDGTITGSTIKTNQLYSLNSEVINGVTRYRFSIDELGYAEFVGARVYGNMTVGSTVQNAIQSGTYNGSTGWRIDGAGNANFFQVNTWDQGVYGTMVVGRYDTNGMVRSNVFNEGSSGWRINSDGRSQFNGGDFSAGSVTGGEVRLVDVGGGNAQVRLYTPGDGSKFHLFGASGQVLNIRGGYGGAIEMYPGHHWDGHALVRIVQDLDVTNHTWIGNTLTVRGGGVNIQAGGLVLGDLAGNGRRYLHVGNGGVVQIGEAYVSSIRYKKNVETLSYTKEQILALRPVHYELRDQFKMKNDQSRYSGFIAEEASTAGLEDFVIYEDGEIETFDYAKFTAALQKVCQEQQKEIDELRKAVSKILAQGA